MYLDFLIKEYIMDTPNSESCFNVNSTKFYVKTYYDTSRSYEVHNL